HSRPNRLEHQEPLRVPALHLQCRRPRRLIPPPRGPARIVGETRHVALSSGILSSHRECPLVGKKHEATCRLLSKSKRLRQSQSYNLSAWPLWRFLYSIVIYQRNTTGIFFVYLGC